MTFQTTTFAEVLRQVSHNLANRHSVWRVSGVADDDCQHDADDVRCDVRAAGSVQGTGPEEFPWRIGSADDGSKVRRWRGR